MDRSWSKLQETVKDGEAQQAAAHGVTKGRTWPSDWTTTTLHPKQLETEQNTPRVGRRKAIVKTRAEINKIEAKETTEKISETKSRFFEQINKTYKPLARFIELEREGVQGNKIRNAKEVTTDSTEIQATIRLLQETTFLLL